MKRSTKLAKDLECLVKYVPVLCEVCQKGDLITKCLNCGHSEKLIERESMQIDNSQPYSRGRAQPNCTHGE